MKDAVKDRIAAVLLNFDENGQAGTAAPPSAEDEPQPPPDKQQRRADADRTAMANFFGEEYFLNAPEQKTELERYSQDQCIPPNQAPLEWWKRNEHRYPELSRVAKAYLSVPATSVPAERIFSAAGVLVNRLRTRLLPAHVDMLLFLNKNSV